MRKILKRILPAITVAVLTTGTALAAHPLITDDTGTQGKGKFSLEVNAEIGQDSESDLSVRARENGASLESVLSAGLFDSVDLVLGVPYEWSRSKENGIVSSDVDGVGDLSLELKWRFFEKRGFSMAFKPAVSFPAGDEDKGLGAGKVGYGATLIATQEFDPFALHLNLGYSHTRFKLQEDRDANRRDIWHVSLAGTAQVMEKLQLSTNFGMETNADKTSDTPPVFAIAGAIYSLTDNLDLDLGVKVGLTKPETDVSLLAGLAVRF